MSWKNEWAERYPDACPYCAKALTSEWQFSNQDLPFRPVSHIGREFAPVEVRPIEDGGVMAAYRCDAGHTWDCSWSRLGFLES